MRTMHACGVWVVLLEHGDLGICKWFVQCVHVPNCGPLSASFTLFRFVAFPCQRDWRADTARGAKRLV